MIKTLFMLKCMISFHIVERYIFKRDILKRFILKRDILKKYILKIYISKRYPMRCARKAATVPNLRLEIGGEIEGR